jgi:hypothetical protein
MNIQLEKAHIIEQVQQINDADLIKALKSLLEYSVKKQAGPVVPEWHKAIVKKRLAKAKTDPASVLSWEDVMQELEG